MTTRRPGWLRTALAWIVGGAATVLLTISGAAISMVFSAPVLVFRMAKLWGRICVWGTGCSISTTGLGRVEATDRYVIMANHQSALDIPLLMATLPPEWKTVFWAKKSLFKIPVLGAAMRSLGHMPVDRVNRRKAGQMLADSQDRIEDTRSTLVFPEETYGPGEDLLPFQRGGFLLALKTDIPILPVGIQGTRTALPPNGRLVAPTELNVRFGEPIATAGRSVADRDQLMDHTRIAILELSGLADHRSD